LDKLLILTFDIMANSIIVQIWEILIVYPKLLKILSMGVNPMA